MNIHEGKGLKVFKLLYLLLHLNQIMRNLFLLYCMQTIKEMKKVNKQCLLDTPHTVRVRKNLSSYSSNQQTLVLKRRFKYNMCKQKL